MQTSRSWSWLAVLMGAALLTVGCTGDVGRLGDPKPPSDGGPLVRPEPHHWCASAKVGAAFTDGREVLYLKGDHRATIEYVRPDIGAGLSAQPALLVGPGRPRDRVQRLPWPVSRDLFAQPVQGAKGTTITTKKQGPQGWELLVRMSATRPGHHVRYGLRIGYIVDGRHHEQYFPARIDVYASTTEAKASPTSCP